MQNRTRLLEWWVRRRIRRREQQIGDLRSYVYATGQQRLAALAQIDNLRAALAADHSILQSMVEK